VWASIACSLSDTVVLEVQFDRDSTVGRRRVIRLREAPCAIVRTVQTLPDASDGLDDEIPACVVSDDGAVDREGTG